MAATTMSRIAYADLGRPGAFTPSVRYTRTPQAEAPEPVAVDPAADAYGTGYREGHAAARAEAEAELMRERQERARIELAFARFDAESALALRENLRTTVLALCEDAVLPLALDRDGLMKAQARALIGSFGVEKADDLNEGQRRDLAAILTSKTGPQWSAEVK